MTLVELDPATFRDRRPHQLSGGQQQRVGLARALAADPNILLMDEPFGALDAVTRDTLQTEMIRIHAATGKTILMVTHDIDEAVRLGQRIVVFDEGKVVQDATPEEVLAKPANDFVRALVGGEAASLRLLKVRRVRDWLSRGTQAEGPPIAMRRTSRHGARPHARQRPQRAARGRQEPAQPQGAIGLGDLLRREP